MPNQISIKLALSHFALASTLGATHNSDHYFFHIFFILSVVWLVTTIANYLKDKIFQKYFALPNQLSLKQKLK